MDQNRLSTEELFALLFKTSSLPLFLEEKVSDITLPAFHDYISLLCTGQNEIPEHIIHRSGLERSYGHQLFSGKRKPSRDTVIQLAFALGADVAEAQEMLKIARKSPLYPRIKRDTVIIYCLHNHISLVETGIILTDLKLPALGGKDQ